MRVRMENIDWTSQVACFKPIHLLIFFFSLAYWKESYQRMSKYLLLIKFLLNYLICLPLMVRNIHIALPLYNFLSIKLFLCSCELNIANVILPNGNSSLLIELEEYYHWYFLLVAHNSWFLVKSNILLFHLMR